MRRVLLPVALIALAACQKPAPNAAANAAMAPAAPANVAVANLAAPATAAAPSQTGGATYPITITLSPAAANLLKSLGQDVIISANYYGNANAQGRHLRNSEGQIDLGDTQTLTLPGAGSATLPVAPYEPSLLADLDGEPQVNINVFSGVGTNPDNKLDCDLFDDKVSLASQQGVRIACKVIGEP